jgi:hypothetical protein
LALSSSLAAKLFADGGLVIINQILFIAFIFIPFRNTVFAKPFIGQTAWVYYSFASNVIFTLLAVVANSSHHLPKIES